MPPLIFLHGTQNSGQRYPYLPAVCRYQQTYPAGDALLKAEAFDYFTFTVLQITGIHATEMEIQAIHVDHAVPLFKETRDSQKSDSQPRYVLRLAKGASISLLLSISSERHTWLNSLFPQNVVILAKQSSIILEANW
jgi:hypothetical protein